MLGLAHYLLNELGPLLPRCCLELLLPRDVEAPGEGRPRGEEQPPLSSGEPPVEPARGRRPGPLELGKMQLVRRSQLAKRPKVTPAEERAFLNLGVLASAMLGVKSLLRGRVLRGGRPRAHATQELTVSWAEQRVTRGTPP